MNLMKFTNYKTAKKDLYIYYTTDCPNLSFNSSANVPNLLAVAVISSIDAVCSWSNKITKYILCIN